MERYRDRVEAGRVLAGLLAHHRSSRPLVLGIAGGGVMVAAEVALALEACLYAAVSVPFGPPGDPGLGLGAATADGSAVIEEDLAARLGLSRSDLGPVIRAAAAAAGRREGALGATPWDRTAGATIVVIDEGVAGGAVLRAVLGRVRRGGPRWVVCALPVGLPAAVDLIAAEVDEIVCPLQPIRFHSTADWYDTCPGVDDTATAALLAAAAR